MPAQPRRPAGTPVGGQFAPTNRPEATGVELVDDEPEVIAPRVEATVEPGIPSFSIEGFADHDCRTTRDRVRAAMLSSGLSWPMGKIAVRVVEPVPERTADLDLEIALGVLKASDQLPDVDVDDLRGELGLDGSIRGSVPPDARNLRQLVDTLKQRRAPALDDSDASGLAFTEWLRSSMVRHGLLSEDGARCVGARGWSEPNVENHTSFTLRRVGDDVEAFVFVDEKAGLHQQHYREVFDTQVLELHDPIAPKRIEPRIERILHESGLDVRTVSYAGHQALWDNTVHYRVRFRHSPSEPIPDGDPTTTGTTRTKEAAESWRLFRESYGGWLDLYRKARAMGGMAETERRLRAAADLAGVDAAQLRADKARAYRGESSEQILEGR